MADISAEIKPIKRSGLVFDHTINYPTLGAILFATLSLGMLWQGNNNRIENIEKLVSKQEIIETHLTEITNGIQANQQQVIMILKMISPQKAALLDDRLAR